MQISKLFIAIIFFASLYLKVGAQEIPKRPQKISKSDWAAFIEKDKYFAFDSMLVFKQVDTQLVVVGKQYNKHDNLHRVTETVSMNRVWNGFAVNAKDSFVYNAVSGKVMERLEYNYIISGANVNGYRYEYNYRYNDSGKILNQNKTIYLNYEPDNPNTWTNMSGDSIVCIYNSNGFPVERRLYDGIRNEIWSLKMKIVADSFGADGQPADLYCSLFLKNGKEIPFRKVHRIKWFNNLQDLNAAEQNITSAVIQNWKAGVWVDSMTEFNYHNRAGKIDSTIIYANQGVVQVPVSKHVFSYGPHNCVDTLEYVYNKTNTPGWELIKGHKEMASYVADRMTFEVSVMETYTGHPDANKKEDWMLVEKRVYR